jgi:protein TonB
MTADSISAHRSHNPTLLMLCIAGSVATHVLVFTLLPAWKALRDSPPRPLTVELAKQEPPEIVPPQPLPMETRPERVTREPVKPAAKPVAEPQPVQAPILTAPLEAPPSPAAVVVPEQRPAPPPEVPRQPPAAAVTPVTPPRSDAAYLNNPRPAYPLAARRRGDQGTVLIRVLVSADGIAASVGLEKTSGHPSLDEAALTAVKSWRFVPARQGGQAIESPYVVPVVFKLD